MSASRLEKKPGQIQSTLAGLLSFGQRQIQIELCFLPVAAARNQLYLARDTIAAQRYPWEAQTRAATPRQVRRAMNQILTQLGTPAQPPQARGKSPGRRRGTKGSRIQTLSPNSKPLAEFVW